MPTERPWYLERAAPGDLVGALACEWRAEVGGTKTLIPDGCLDLLWIDDGSLWLCGPETQAWTFSLPPGTEAVGVRFKPAVAPAVLGLDASELLNTRVRLEQLDGDAPARRLGAQVGDEPTAAGRVAVLEEHERRLRTDARPVDPVAAEVAGRLGGAEARPRVQDLAEDLGLSARQLHRRCTSAFGYGPVVLARILRLQRFLAEVRRHGTAGGLATLAITSGYADQPHLNREVKAITGATPGELTAAVRSVQDGELPRGRSSTHEHDQ
jgi:AraC-like DNA-binding protein